MQIVMILFLILFSFAGITVAQSEFGDNIPGASIHSCEEFSARIDSVRNAAKTSGEKIFVIFHAGKTESEIVNSRRMAYVRDYLKGDSSQWKELDVIYARGERSSKNSVIAFYFAGKLVEAMSSPRNMTPCMDCCEAKYYTPQSLLKPIDFKSIRAKENRKSTAP